MEEVIEFNGYWWFPNKSEKEKLFGNLKFVQGEGAILNISDFSGDVKKSMKEKSDVPYYDIILGLSSEGKKISLYKCHKISSNYKFAGIEYEDVHILSLKVDYIFVGYHFKKVEEIKFKYLSIQYSYLDEWLNKPLEMDDIDRDKPDRIPLTKNSDYNVFISFYRSHSFDSFTEIVIKQFALISIESFTSGKHWREYMELIRFIQYFLTIAVMKPVYPLKIKGKVRPDKIIHLVDDSFEGPIVSTSPNIDIYITYTKIPKFLEKVNSYDMLFSYDEINDNIKRFLLNWLVNASLFRSIYNTYFSTVYNKNLFLENQFLNVIMAFEGYHRSRTTNKEIDDYSHNKRVESIIKGAPSSYKGWIKSHLAYSNEPSLRKRLRNILKPYRDVFGGKEIVEDFISKVINNRNSLVHKDRDIYIDYEELNYSLVILKVVFELYLLEDMGLDKDYIKELIKKRKDHYAFKYMDMI